MILGDYMDFKEILAKCEKEKLILGTNEEESLIVDIKKSPSIIITGETGAGKSILLDQIILELINTHTSLEMGFVLVDTSGVELNLYQESNYALFSAINDMEKSVVAISKVLREIDRRKELLRDNHVATVDEYNDISDNKLPLLVLAIDDDKLLLREPDMEKMLSGIISQISGLNIFFILATSDVFNKFFEHDENIFASFLISFDYTNEQESKNNNISGSNDLEIGAFLAKYQGNIKKYHNFEFDDNLIKEVLRYHE